MGRRAQPAPAVSSPPRPVGDLIAYLLEVCGEAAAEPRFCAALEEGLPLALTHRSYAYEAGGVPHNERLEFLGDSVLGVVVTDSLFRTHPDLPEGQLARLRAAVVNSKALATVGRTIDLGDYLLLGRGEESTGGRDKDSILADAVEAVLGAVYLAGGMDIARELIHTLFGPLMRHSATLGAGLDWKSSLQEATAAHGLSAPVYEIESDGPEHAKTFQARVLVDGVARGQGSGRTKKDAEMQAAEAAVESLGPAPDPAP
ncbi:MAG: ribonuclease III [Intrasporangiaceae bacterium]|nr:ribonuclease III [Intrasporangiaceae bacterium]